MMTSKLFKSGPIKHGLAIPVLMVASVFAQAADINLTAGPTTTKLPDGQSVPMWGYSCGAVVAGSTATCAKLNPAAGSGWSPVVITVPSGTTLNINLTNNLDFGSGAQEVPTSIVIVGQLGGGLGSDPRSGGTQRLLPLTQHVPQGTTWPGTLGGTGPDDTVFTPPTQVARVRSFASEVAAGATGALCWGLSCGGPGAKAPLRPGTYLIQSGTEPSIQGPMGLYGVLIVTDANYPGTPPSKLVAFDKDVTLLLSEIDPVQNAAVTQAVKTAGFNDAAVWSAQTGKCGDPAVHTCYPPAVNYDPRYYLINGVSFDRNKIAASTQDVGEAAAKGNVLLRFVNAGLRMHIPSVVNANLTLRAEDGNILPGEPRKQSTLFMAAGKTFDVTISPKLAAGTSATCLVGPCYAANTYAVFDRALGLSTNNQRDGGMQAHLKIGTGGAAAPVSSSAAASPDNYFVVSGNELKVTDPAKGLIANDVGIYGVSLLSGSTVPGLTLNSNGTFAYTGLPTTFTYCGNDAISGPACATVTLAACDASSGCLGGAPVANADSYPGNNVATRLSVSAPGVLLNDSDPLGLKLKAIPDSIGSCASVDINEDGSFTATSAAGVSCSFTYKAVNSQNTASDPATVNVTFPSASGLVVHVLDGKTNDVIDNYRWVIEEDRSVFIDPTKESAPGVPVRNVAVNFHTSYLPVVAEGCVGDVSCESGQKLLGVDAACDIGNGICTTDRARKADLLPGDVHLDPLKRYYISILPGDGANPVTEEPGYVVSGLDPAEGHTMSGAQIAAGQHEVNVYVQKTPLEPAKIAVFVFEDDSPLNGEVDTGGGVDVLAPNEPGLAGFNIVLLDQAGGMGDSSGQITYDMFGQPVSNSLAGMIDPATGRDACPISPTSNDGLVGMIVTCPKYEANRPGQPRVLSPLAGHAVIANMYPGLYEVVATPGADRIAKGEEWLQTNTLDGTKAIEAFIKAGEPAYFQEFGPGGFHVAVGFANPALINARRSNAARTGLCDPVRIVNGTNVGGGGLVCTAQINGIVTATRMSRTPDQRVYSSESYDAYSFGQCYVSLGTPDSDDFALTKCNADGTFKFTNVPKGDMKVTVFDQWNDLLVDGLSTPVKVDGEMIGTAANPIDISVTQWRTNLYGRVFLDTNGDGVSNVDSDGNATEPGLPLVPYNIRYRDGSYAGFNNTDLAGFAGFNEVFPFLNWLVVDTNSARFKQTGVHVVYDTGGPVDGTTGGGNSAIAATYANTIETFHLPNELRVPGAIYCEDADCVGTKGHGIANPSSGRVDPGWVQSEGWQGLLGQNSFIEFAMKPFKDGENGGIKGDVLYTPTRPFDDPALLLQLSWAPGIPNVKVNLYKKGVAADGVSETLQLVDTTTSSSWDDWAQGFRKNADGTTASALGGAIPNMSCPGQGTDSPFYFTMIGGTQALNPGTAMAADGRYKCYDGWSMLNQVQPAPYNGQYRFPSIVNRNPVTGAPEGVGKEVNPAGGSVAGTSCTICTANPDDGTPMLPPGKYVVEVIVPQGYELVKEEDKNILLGDAFNGPAVTQFAGFGNVFIMPDQAAVGAAYNPTNPIQSTNNNGAVPRREGDTGSVEVFWPCVGTQRIVPDFNSLYPLAGQAAPFAGATRPLCDRKEIVLGDQMTALAKFYLFSSTHVAAKFTGVITNDFASEFDPFSPQFGEKFGVANVPVAFRDFTGKEISRVYADQWGAYNGANFSTFTVNPPSPSGYVPQMMIACMNDPGPIADPADPTKQITDPAYNPAYSNFCYETPFMPGQTSYLDTPVIPTMAHAAGYNLPDCEYPDTTPAIKLVAGSDGVAGPWVSNSGSTHRLTITALGDRQVLNHAYSGPMATTAPFNKKFITRHYGFGSQCSSIAGACTSVSTVKIGGVTAPIVSWTDLAIVVSAPAGVPSCGANGSPLQRTGSGASTYPQSCGELEITAGNGRKSIDAVTVTIGGKTPTYVTPGSQSVSTFGHIQPNPLQTAIDKAAPGDLIIIGPGNYPENLLMWKPVRLQGVGAESVTINADAHPAGKMDAWRRQLNCLFGMALNGRPITGGNVFDANGTYSCPLEMRQHVDRIPFEAILGWDVTGNGNLAQMLQEPTLMGAYEGAGVTVLAKGVSMPSNTSVDDQFGAATAGGFPVDYQYLNSGTGFNGNCRLPDALTAANTWRDYYSSNFLCNPSRIDGVSVINSSQGGGGIFAHAWNHYLEVANTRVHGNHGTLTGGITIGNGEFPDPFIAGGDVAPPFPVANNIAAGTQLGYGFNRNVSVHHNSVTSNASIGDALYSATPSAAGGVTFCTGSDTYKFSYNWICGNLSTGDAGGVAHSGFINDGTILGNQILFNQSQSATVPTNGGGLGVLGASPDRTITTGPNAGQECGSVTDQDCPPGLPEGTGRNLLIDSNLIMGNSAESGTGGGLRLQMVNGEDIVAFPRNPNAGTTGNNRAPGWNSVTVQNNIITNNVAGWDGGGVSLQDALMVKFVNNTVMFNDTTASAGVLFNTLGASLAAVPPPGCTPPTEPGTPLPPGCINPVKTSTNQAAGFVTMPNTPNMVTALTGVGVTCPSGYGYVTIGALNQTGACRDISLPLLTNNVLSQNRAFHVEVSSGLGTGLQNQQKVITLVPALNQTTTGEIVAVGTDVGAPGSGGPVNLWDIGVRGDTGPTNHASTYRLSPTYSILSATGTDYAGGSSNNLVGSDPQAIHPYANGARIPPEGCAGVAAIDQPRCKGFHAPAGRSEFTGLGVVFSLNQTVVAATVDEGNNWINLGFGPLSLSNASSYTASNTQLPALGDYSIAGTSPAVNAIASGSAAYTAAPAVDFFGTQRKTNSRVDIGAVEYQQPAFAVAAVSPTSLAFGNQVILTASAPRTLTLSNTGGADLTGIAVTVTAPYSRPAGAAGGTCGVTLTVAAATCTINIVFTPSVLGATSGATVAIAASVPVTGTPVSLTGTGIVPPPLPSISVIDTFDRANANTLGANWQQLVTLANSGIRVNGNQAFCVNSGLQALLCLAGANAYWSPTVFGAKQAAAFAFTSTILGNESLYLKAGGTLTLGTYANAIRVRYSGGQVIVETTTNGVTFTTNATFAVAGGFANNDVLTAQADATGTVSVWKTSGVTTTFIGQVALPNTGGNAFVTGTGRVGLSLPSGGRVDNFRGATVP